MDFLFRLPDGERLALWGEKGQIVRMLSAGNRSRTVIRSDYLSDLSAVMVEGKIYFVYQNVSGEIMLHLPDEEEDILLMAERLENCRFKGLTLTVWQRKLYLFYFAWNAVREANLLKMREIFRFGADDTVEGSFSTEHEGLTAETEVWEDRENVPIFEVSAAGDRLTVCVGENELHRIMTSEGTYLWERGSRITDEEIEALRRKTEKDCEALCRKYDEAKQQAERELYREREQIRELEGRLISAVEQYNELTTLAQKLQAEGKKWRDRYLAETKKKRERSGTVKVRRTIGPDGQNT